MARHMVARARFDVRPRQRVLPQLDARESVEAMMLSDGHILPVFEGLDTPLATKAPSRKGDERHKVDVVTIVEPNCTPDTHAGNHDFFTFRRGMECHMQAVSSHLVQHVLGLSCMIFCRSTALHRGGSECCR